jgi:exopolysaccharide biosynthesis polyprenyl glycosylphosphotransferase
LVFCAVAGIALLTFRATLRGGLQRTLGPERVLLLGVRAATLPLVRSMRLFPEYGQEPVGVLELPGDSAPAASLGVTRIGHLGDRPLDEVLDMVRADRVLVSSADTDDERLAEVLRRCRRRSVKVSVVPTMFDGLGPSVELDHIAGLPLLAVNPPVLTRSSRVAKRAIDVAASAAGLLVLLPVLAIIAVAIKLDSRGPVLFVQQRIGRGGRSFPLFKFRTMVADAEAQRRELLRHSKDDGWLHLEDDPRITRVGRLLRHTSLDELPQLLNVVRGEMSLVGPRPLIVEEDERIDGWRRARLDLTPGITGMWQVLGRTAISFDDMVKLDYLYVTNWSLANDLRLLLRTLPVVLTRRGAN